MQISIGNRLFSFLIRSIKASDEFAVSIISEYYPFTLEQLHKYSSKLSWVSVGTNENICWSKDFYENFKSYIPLSSLSHNEKFPWTEEFIADNFKELFYYQGETTNISSNEALPWSIDFIDKYKEHWDWYWLTWNCGIPFTKELIDKFKDNWDYDVLYRNRRIKADEELRKLFKLPPPSEHNCIFCYKDRFYVIEQRKFSLKLMTDCPYFRWDRKLLERIRMAINIGKLHPSCVGYFETSIYKWNIDTFEVFEEFINYTMLTINDSAGNYIVNVIKEHDLLDKLMEQLPAIDFGSRRYTFSLDTPDDPDDDKIGLN